MQQAGQSNLPRLELKYRTENRYFVFVAPSVTYVTACPLISSPHRIDFDVAMRKFSLRTLLVAMMGVSVLCALFTTRGWQPDGAHLLLVLAFAVPAGSLAFDRWGTHRSVVIGTCVGAIVGTILISAAVLIVDFWRVTG